MKLPPEVKMEFELSPEMLQRVASRLLEEAAFVFTEPVGAEAPSWDGEVLEVELAFSGHGRGWLMLAAPKRFGVQLASNLLGVDPGEDTEMEEHGTDALREMLNMIAGPLMEEWFGKEAVCEIGIPRAESVPRDTHEARRRGATCCASLLTEEEDHVELLAFVEGAQA